MYRSIDYDSLIGHTWGQFKLIKVLPHIANMRRKGLFACSCGRHKEVDFKVIFSGNTQSCGCSKLKNLTKQYSKTHGLSKTPLYAIYYSMMSRCYDVGNAGYHNYGGRGISVCDEWKGNVVAFVEWAKSNGWQKGLEIDRRNNNNGYSPDNCWVRTMVQNRRNKSNNKKVTYNGQTKCCVEWDEMLGFRKGTVAQRIRYGWSESDAIELGKGEKPKRIIPT